MSHWRDDLRTLIRNNPALKKQIADTLGCSIRGPERWIAEDNNPSPRYAAGLAKMFPQLRASLRSEIPTAFAKKKEPPVQRIPAIFYDEILTALAYANMRVGKPAMIGSLLTQMLGHLDPERDGLLIALAQCRLDNGLVNSLQIAPEHWVGTGPWSKLAVEDAIRVLPGTLIAASVSQFSPVSWTIDDAPQYAEPVPTAFQPDLAECAVAYPLLREGSSVAGALFFVATQDDFFSQATLDLIKRYATLFAVAFRDREFYDDEQLKLKPEPTTEEIAR